MNAITASAIQRLREEKPLNRAERRAFMRAGLAEYRRSTRFWRRAWRGVFTQGEIVSILKGMDKRGEVILPQEVDE